MQQPYDGPYKIIKRHDKHFTVDVKDKESVISIDRLKPAYFEDFAESVPTTQETLSPPPLSPPKITRSGRQVHWPKRYVTCTFIN